MSCVRTVAVLIALFACALQAFAGGSPTTTTLTFIANGSPVNTLIQGRLITLTASVTSNGAPLTVGQVEFCDASYPYCTDVHQLALAQLTSAGTATFRFIPSTGSHRYKAIFLGTNNYASSTSSVQTLTVTPSGYNDLSSTTLAFSGSPGDYTLTATVTGGSDPAAPSGTVSFLDTDNANYVLGTATLVPTVSQLTFVNSSNPSLGEIVGSFEVGDFNGDGIPDLAVPSFGSGTSGTVIILLGNGDGTFTQGQTFATPHAIQVTKVADFNGDGIADLVMLEALQTGQTDTAWLQTALGNGDGTFTLLPPTLLTMGSENPQLGGFAVGDFNGDGKTDLVIEYSPISASTNPLSLWFFPGNGDGTFGSPTVAYQNSGLGSCGTVADFNGDGNLDLACSNGGSGGALNPPPGSISVLLGDGQGSFSPGSSVTVGAGATSIAVADFNGDGKADLATVSWYYSAPNILVTTAAVALGNGDGTFAAPTSLPVSLNAQTVVVAGDFNGDGLPDFAAIYGVSATPPTLFTVYLSNGNGTFSANDVTVPDSVRGSLSYAAGDFNRDGRWDLALNGGGIGPLGIFLSEPTSATATVTGISPVGTGIHLIDASYPGSGIVLSPSSSNTVGLEAEPEPTTLTLLAAPTGGVYQQPFTLAATVAPTTAQNHTAGGTVTFYSNGVSLGTSALASGAATLNVSTVLPVGTYNLTATYSGDSNFAGSTDSLQFIVSASPSPITFTVPNHTFGDPPFTVAAASVSTGAFTYSVVSGPATISGNTVTLTGAGTVVLQASQAASGNYAAAFDTAVFTVAEEAQTIAFPAPASPLSFGAAPIALSAAASSGLPVAFSVLSGPATLTGSTVTITGVGPVVIAANQPGNQNYLAASQVSHTIVVNKGLPALTMTASQNPVFIRNPVTLTATVASSAATPTGSITFSDGSTLLGTEALNAGVASLTVATLPLGPNSITASYSGDGSFNTVTSTALNQAVQDFAFTVAGSTTQTVQYGGAATYTFAIGSVDGPTTPSAIGFAVSGAPAGSIISFTPATVAAGTGTANPALTIQVPSVIAASQGRGHSPATSLAALALVCVLLPLRCRMGLRGNRSSRFFSALLLLASAGACAGATGCGANEIVTRVQTFAITATASSGALSHSAATTLTVQ